MTIAEKFLIQETLMNTHFWITTDFQEFADLKSDLEHVYVCY